MSMVLPPAPPNEFTEFIPVYFERCRQLVPEIEANAGKWTFVDLIPGLSDFDTRFIVRDGMSADDWCRMSTAVGEVHFELVRENRHWARTLEHLPGVNLEWRELFDESLYFPEFSQWSFYEGDPGRLQSARDYTARRTWRQEDALYHWKKIATYYGRYNRTIDPPVNLGIYEVKYPLHSRLMHYLAPPVHSAVCLVQEQTTPGKMKAFEVAGRQFPHSHTMSRVLDLIACHYEEPALLQEPGLTKLDDALEQYLGEMVNTLLESQDLVLCSPNPSPAELMAAVRHAGAGQPPGFADLFENVKFARLMKGRLWFYSQDTLWFDSLFLIRNELSRIRSLFLEGPVRLFVQVVQGERVSTERALEIISSEVWSKEEVNAARRFLELSAPECPDTELKLRARQIAASFDPFLHALEHLVRAARQSLRS